MKNSLPTLSKSEAFRYKTVAFTGTLETMKRDEAFGLVEKAGGRPTTSIDLGTDILVMGRTNLAVVGSSGKSRKLREAERRGIRIMDEDEFLEHVQA